jgi:solute carrier family 25 (peroxisomal adenine nucleotide transporter), member 17
MQVQPTGKSQKLDGLHYASPLDALQKIVKQDGILGLYTGIFGGLVGVASTNFAYFYWYTLVRDAYKRRKGIDGPLSTAMELVLGAVAGALAQIFTIPVSVCTTRQQTQIGGERKGLIATAKEVVSEDGITGLWRGLKPSLVLVVNPAITYGLFERFKDVMYPNTSRLTPGQSFFVGAASKTVATIVTYPYIMAKVRMQFKPPSPPKSSSAEGGVVAEPHEGSEFDRHDGAVQILRKIYKKSGFLGWYQVVCLSVELTSGTKHSSLESSSHASYSLLLQRSIHPIHHRPHCPRQTPRLETDSSRQIIRK